MPFLAVDNFVFKICGPSRKYDSFCELFTNSYFLRFSVSSLNYQTISGFCLNLFFRAADSDIPACPPFLYLFMFREEK